MIIALLGTGTMGAGMARRIATSSENDVELRVWNRTRERAEPLADVARVCDTVAEAVADAEVVVTMLYDAASAAGTMEAGRGSFADGAVWLQTSTVGVDGSAELARTAEALGLDYLDAPVLGTRKPAADGALVVLASGPPALRERVDVVLDAIGSRTLWVGEEAGAGSRLKLACNAWVLTVVQGVAESLALTRELGLDPSLFLEAVNGSAVDAPYVGLKGRAMIDGDLDPDFALAGGLKDLELILEAAGGVGLEQRVASAVRDRFAVAVDQGLGDQDLAATYSAL